MRRAGGETGEIRYQFVADQVHRRRVKCEIEIEGANRDAAPTRFGLQSVDRLAGAGHRHRMCGVDRPDFEGATDFAEQLTCRGLAQRERRHPAVAARPLLVPAARDDNARRIRQRQRAGRPGSGDFTDAVADMSGRIDAEPAQHRHDADLDREQQRLRDIGMHEPVRFDAALDQFGNRPTKIGPQGGIGLGDSIAKGCAGMARAAPHTGPLRSVSGEHKGKLPVAQRASGHHVTSFIRDKFAKRRDQLGLIRAKHDEALRVMIAAPRRCPHHAGHPLGRAGGDRLMPALRQFAQRCFGARRDHQRRKGRVRWPAILVPPWRRSQYGVAIGAAKAERVEAGAPVTLQRLHGAHEAQVELIERDPRVRGFAMQARR